MNFIELLLERLRYCVCVPHLFFFLLFSPPPLQPMVFGAMIHRDEAFDAIIAQYNKIHGEETLTCAET